MFHKNNRSCRLHRHTDPLYLRPTMNVRIDAGYTNKGLIRLGIGADACPVNKAVVLAYQ